MSWPGVVLAIVVFLPGCGSEHRVTDPEPDPWRPVEIPINDTPLNTMIRFERQYEFEALPTYSILLASDFRYTFSQAADPNLVVLYGENWRKDDEVESSRHLFEGFTNTVGETIPAASRIDMTLYGVQFTVDPGHPDSAAYYQKGVVSTVVMTIEVPGTPEPTSYNIDARHEFYVVRGDAAVLDAGQEPRTDRWYIRRWDDLSGVTGTSAMFVGGPTPTQPMTWGRLKASYR